MSRVRLSLEGLRTALDLPAHVTITGASISGGFLDLDLEGANLDPPPPFTTARMVYDETPPPDELVAEYEVRLSHRHFLRFKLPEGPPELPIGQSQVDPAIEAGIAAMTADTLAEMSASVPLAPDVAEGIESMNAETLAAMAASTPLDEGVRRGIEEMTAETLAAMNPTAPPVVEESTPPSGPGSRGRRGRKE